MELSGTAHRALGADVAEGVAAVLRALADPLRLRIVSALATAPGGRMPAGEIASLTEVTAPTVSHHLKALREAGVLVARRRGTWVFYSLAPGMDRVAGTLLDSLAAAAARAAAPADGDDGVDEPGTGGLLDTEAVLRDAATRLAARHPGADPDDVTRLVRESYADLARTARVTRHLPVLAERFAAQRLADLRRAADAAASGTRTPQVLFVCVANAGRSQLAAALLRRYAGDGVVVRSAGSQPAPHVHAAVQPYLAALLADAPSEDAPFPKPLTDDAVRAADVVVTMGCGDSCPVLPGKRYEDWAVGDPALASPAGVRAIFEDLDARVRALAAELVPGLVPQPVLTPVPDVPPTVAPTGAAPTTEEIA